MAEVEHYRVTVQIFQGNLLNGLSFLPGTCTAVMPGGIDMGPQMTGDGQVFLSPALTLGQVLLAARKNSLHYSCSLPVIDKFNLRRDDPIQGHQLRRHCILVDYLKRAA